MNVSIRRFLILLLILGLSVGFGFAFDGIAERTERKQYPLNDAYAPLISEYASEFGVPEAILWAIVYTESEFVSNAVSDDGAIGLMQITPTEMEDIYKLALHEEIPDQGLLYDPKTNLRAGAAWLSFLYERYGVWNTVYAAWHIGCADMDAFLADPENLNELGQPKQYPTQQTEAFVARVQKSVAKYTELYYET